MSLLSPESGEAVLYASDTPEQSGKTSPLLWFDTLWRRRGRSGNIDSGFAPDCQPTYSPTDGVKHVQESIDFVTMAEQKCEKLFSTVAVNTTPDSDAEPDIYADLEASLGHDVMSNLHVEACHRVMSLPAVQKLIETQLQALAGDPEVVLASIESKEKGSDEDEHERSRPKADEATTSAKGSKNETKVGEASLETATHKMQEIVDLLKNSKRSGETSKPKPPGFVAGHEGNAVLTPSAFTPELPATALQGIPCPLFKKLSAGSNPTICGLNTACSNSCGHTTWTARPASKELMGPCTLYSVGFWCPPPPEA